MQLLAVHALLSSQVMSVWVQAPLLLSHASAVHKFPSSQLIGWLSQTLLKQVSTVQRLPSVQSNVSHGLSHPGMSAKTQEPASHESVVQLLPSSQTISVKIQPTAAAQESDVQRSPSVHATGG
jgi:hypothetical protein